MNKKCYLPRLPGKLGNEKRYIDRLNILERTFNILQGVRLETTELHYETQLGITSTQSRYSNSAVTLLEYPAM